MIYLIIPVLYKLFKIDINCLIQPNRLKIRNVSYTFLNEFDIFCLLIIKNWIF